MGDWVSTTEAAKTLNISPGRVRQLILAGQLPTQKVGNVHFIRRSALHGALRPPGRPRSVAGKTLVIYCDGVAWNNPYGPGGWGAVIYTVTCRRQKKQRELVRLHGGLPAPTTNNEAEYEALQQALSWVVRASGTPQKVSIYSDSDLVVNQVNGTWNCRAENLQPLKFRCKLLLEQLGCEAALEWVPREENVVADEEAAQGCAEIMGITPIEMREMLDAQQAAYANLKNNKRTVRAALIQQTQGPVQKMLARLENARASNKRAV